MIKAVFFDIDGTLVSFHTHRVSEAIPASYPAVKDSGNKSIYSYRAALQVLIIWVIWSSTVCDPEWQLLLYRTGSGHLPEDDSGDRLGTSDKVSGREGDLPLYFCPGEGYVYQL